MSNKKQFNGYFIETSEFSNQDVFVFEKDITKEYIDIIQKNNIKAIRITYTVFDNIQNIDLLKDLRNIEEIGIFNTYISNISFIDSYEELKILHLDCNIKGKVNFSKYKKLEEIFFVWKSKYNSIFFCNSLKKVNIYKYSNENLELFNNLSNLKYLKLQAPKLKSIKNLKNLKNISFFGISDCLNLLSIDGIQNLSSIEEIEISNCNKIQDINLIGNLKTLEKLTIDNCGKINSIEFLRDCINLKKINIIGNTDIIDGKLFFLKEIKSLERIRFVEKRHYDSKMEDFSK